MEIELFCSFLLLYVNRANAELFPEAVALSETVSLNPLMPNNEQSVRDCPYTYYPYANRHLASSIFAEPYLDKTFAHVVKLDTLDDQCIGAIVDDMHILTTKQCALKEPKTISFHNISLPHWGIQSTTYHLSLDVALLRLKTSLKLDNKITPACFWSATTSSGFSTVYHVTRDLSTGSLLSSPTECRLSQREPCFTNAKRVDVGFLQIKAVSNYRLHPFIVALGVDEDGAMLEVSNYANWIQTETQTSIDAIDCAVRHQQFREYEDRATTHRSNEFVSVQLQNAYVAPSINNGYKASIGHYAEDNVKESVITYNCYGSLIARQYVLTTASCLSDLKDYSFIVRLNQVKNYAPASEPEFPALDHSDYLNEIYVSKVYIHPNFSAVPLKNDIALLQLDPHDFSFDGSFKPACLWTRDSTKIREFQTNGHGPERTTGYSHNQVLQRDQKETELYLISKVQEDCPLNLTTHQICVGDDAVVVPGTCENNYGSAMSRQVFVFDNFIYDYIFAIDNKGQNCGFNTPSTFTKVSPYLNWIDSIMFGENVVYNDTDAHYGDECVIPNRTTGVCLTISECPGIVDNLMQGNVTHLEKGGCGFEKDDSLVCCSTADSMDGDKSDDQLQEVVNEIENCSNLYSELRKNKSPYGLRKGTATFVALIKAESSNDTCDATLITKIFLITSASCYKRLPQDDALTIIIGGIETQQREIEKAIVHPRFNNVSLINNIVVIKSKSPVTITSEVIPACLWRSHTHVPFLLEVAGTKDEVFNVPVYPLYQRSCEAEQFSNLSNSELCVSYDAVYKDSKPVTCHDAGTGIYSYFAHGLYEEQVSYFIGIYNRASGCENETVGVFTRISSHFGWIKTVICRNG